MNLQFFLYLMFLINSCEAKIVPKVQGNFDEQPINEKDENLNENGKEITIIEIKTKNAAKPETLNNLPIQVPQSEGSRESLFAIPTPKIGMVCATSISQDSAYSCQLGLINPPKNAVINWKTTANTCSWITIDGVSGVLSGIPNDNDVGICDVKVQVESNGIIVDEKNIQLFVNNLVPKLNLNPNSYYLTADLTTFEVKNDSDIQSSEESYGTYSLLSPESKPCTDFGTLSINPFTGAIEFVQNALLYDICNIDLKFSDGNGGDVTGSFKLVGQPHKILAAGGLAKDMFGTSVKIRGNLAIVGAFQHGRSPTAPGFAIIYRYNGTQWIEEQRITPSDGAANDNFGYAVDIQGNQAFVSSPRDDDRGTTTGAVYVFTYINGVWTQSQKLLAADSAGLDWFGLPIAVDGSRLAIAASGDNNFNGSVYIFNFDGTNWVEGQKLNASDMGTSMYESFGNDIELRGNRLVVGAFYKNDSKGAVYVYEYNGTNWVEFQKIEKPGINNNDMFGMAVALSDNQIFINCYYDDHAVVDGGAVYIYNFDGTSWIQSQVLTSNNMATNDAFGAEIEFYNNKVIIGATGKDSNRGSMYEFKLQNNMWSQNRTILQSGLAANSYFGGRISVFEDFLLASAMGENGNIGAAYFYRIPD